LVIDREIKISTKQSIVDKNQHYYYIRDTEGVARFGWAVGSESSYTNPPKGGLGVSYAFSSIKLQYQ
jgi:hypothetical protein